MTALPAGVATSGTAGKAPRTAPCVAGCIVRLSTARLATRPNQRGLSRPVRHTANQDWLRQNSRSNLVPVASEIRSPTTKVEAKFHARIVAVARRTARSLRSRISRMISALSQQQVTLDARLRRPRSLS